jgi:hypothetical protein
MNCGTIFHIKIVEVKYVFFNNCQIRTTTDRAGVETIALHCGKHDVKILTTNLHSFKKKIINGKANIRIIVKKKNFEFFKIKFCLFVKIYKFDKSYP